MTSATNSTIGPPVFIPQKHPELTQLGRNAINIFLKERERYLLRAADAIAQGSGFKPVSLVSSIDFDLLESLIEFDTFSGITSRSELTDEVLLRWLTGQIDTVLDSMTIEELDGMVRKAVRTKVSEPDPKLRIMSLFMDYKTFLRRKKLESLTTSNTKTAVRHICGLLRPPTLRRKIENDLALHKSSLKKDWKGFYNFVVEMAVACEQYVPCTEKESSPASTRSTFDKSSNAFNRNLKASHGRLSRQSQHDSTSATTAGNEDTSVKRVLFKDSAPPKNPSTSPTTPGKKQPPLCLNKKTCPDERHYVYKCPKSTPEEKRILLDEYVKQKAKPAGALKQLATSLEAVQPPESSNASRSNGRIPALLADTVPVVINGDYGCDHAALSEDQLNLLASASVFVSILPLTTPITMELAVKGCDVPITVTAERKARISTTLNTLEGSFRLRNVEYLVFKEHMDEVLLSRPLLQSLGFNLDEHLARVRSQYHDIDCSHITFESDLGMATVADELPGKFSRLVSQEVDADAQYLDESDDETSSLPPTTSVRHNTTLMDDDVIDVGDHVPPDVLPYLQRMLQQAVDNGLSQAHIPRLQHLLHEYADVFRLKLGSDPPVAIPPMNIRLKPDSDPVRVKVRRYAPQQAAFLRQKVGDLERLGLVKRNHESSWACAPLIVPKPGPEQFRFTTDLRPVNKLTLPHAWPMPDLETVLARLSSKRCFATIDLCQGYWQLPLAEDSQECQSFITPEGVYTPTRVMHGQRNAVAYCQSSVQRICESILDNLLLWLDDILFHATDEGALLNILDQFLALCQKYGLKLHAGKCKLFLQEVKWCGRVISREGVRMDPSRLQALLNMPYPSAGDELQQFACAANWMRSGIPEFTTVMSPLHELLEKVYTKARGRTKRRASKIKLSDVGWSTEHETAFDTARRALANSVTLSHPDPSMLLCLFTDASDKHWSGVLTQITPSELDLPFVEQRHLPLAFLSGSFKGSSIRWSTPEKEAAAIIYSVE